MGDRFKSYDNLALKGGTKTLKKKRGNKITAPGSSLTDRNQNSNRNNNNILPDSSPRVSKYQRDKQQRSPIKNAKVHRTDRMASKRTETLDNIVRVASTTSKRQLQKDRNKEPAVDLHGFEFQDCLEQQEMSQQSGQSVQSQQSVQSVQSQPIELDNENESSIQQHGDESLDMVNQVVDQMKLRIPRKERNRKKPLQNFLPPKSSSGLGLAFRKVNTPHQRSNVRDEIENSSDEDSTWRVQKKNVKLQQKRERQKKELELMQKRQEREEYGTDYHHGDSFTDDFESQDLGVKNQPSSLKKSRRKRARSQAALSSSKQDDSYLQEDETWLHYGDTSQKRKQPQQEQQMELEQKKLLQSSKEKAMNKFGKSVKSVGQAVKKGMDSATKALTALTTPSSKRYKKAHSFLDDGTPSESGTPPNSKYYQPRRSTRSSARKKVVDEVIELSSDEESDDDMSTPQQTVCDNDAAIAATLNQELNHSSRNYTKKQILESEHPKRERRTRSTDSKCFVECTRIAIGNVVYFEDMEMSFVPSKQKQYFELDLDIKTKLQVDVEDIEEAQYYMPYHHESGIASVSAAESDESVVDTGNDNDLNDLVDTSDDEADLKKSMNAQKRVTIDDIEAEEEEEEEQSLKVVSADTSREVTSEMLEGDKDANSSNHIIALDDDNSCDDGDTLVNDSSQPTDVNAAKLDSQESVQIVDTIQNRKQTLCVDDSSDEEDPATSKYFPVDNRKFNHDSSDSSALVEHGTLPKYGIQCSEDHTMKSDQDEATMISRSMKDSQELNVLLQNTHQNDLNESIESAPDDHLQDIAMNFEDKFEEAKSDKLEESAVEKSNEFLGSDGNLETKSLALKSDTASTSILESKEETEDDIRNHYYLILRAKPSKQNGLASFSSKHYYRTLPKSSPTKSALLAKRYIVIESNNQADFDHLITLLKENTTIGMFFTNDNNRLTHETLEEEIVSLLNFKKPMQPICEEHETALVFPSSLLETELDFVSSNLIEPNGKLGQNFSSMFTNFANKEKASNGKQKNHIITIRGEDYDRLAPGEFLNDTLIDFWISWLIYRMGNASNQVHVFTTQFYTKLEQEGVESVISWTAKKNIDIFEKKYVFVPVNKDIHWSLLVIVNPGKIISDDDEEESNKQSEHPYILFMDSLRAHKKAKLQKTLYKWLNAEAARLHKFDRKNPFSHLTCPVENPPVPRQNNCWDCGVFVCRYAFAMLHLLDTRIKCTLTNWRDNNLRKELIKQNITQTEAFNFGMDDIARLREEMAILIQDLHRIYKQKLEEKKTKKKAKKQQTEDNSRIENHGFEKHANGDITVN